MLLGVAPLNESTRPRVLIAYEAGWQRELKLERGTIRQFAYLGGDTDRVQQGFPERLPDQPVQEGLLDAGTAAAPVANRNVFRTGLDGVLAAKDYSQGQRNADVIEWEDFSLLADSEAAADVKCKAFGRRLV
jgi:hypothetical protein